MNICIMYIYVHYIYVFWILSYFHYLLLGILRGLCYSKISHTLLSPHTTRYYYVLPSLLVESNIIYIQLNLYNINIVSREIRYFCRWPQFVSENIIINYVNILCNFTSHIFRYYSVVIAHVGKLHLIFVLYCYY